MTTEFHLVSDFAPKGSQPKAIESLISGFESGSRFQTLLGVTGSGKTFTIANLINEIQKPTLVIAHNKTLAAQLYNEFREFFPENRVEYFVSYYDYYQPESYLPKTDQYIEKDAQINPKIEQMRLSTTASLMSRPDVIVVASVSCIYGLGNPENFQNMGFDLCVHDHVSRNEILSRLIEIQFERNDLELMHGRFRVKGDTIDLIPAYFNNIIRIEMFGDEIDRITEIDKNSGRKLEEMDYFYVYPARHFVIPEDAKKSAIASILEELESVLPSMGMLESHRLKQRTLYDVEMIEETGICKGIENYSRHFDRRSVGEKPYCLLDYFPEDFLMMIDESHQTIPQIHGMYKGDYSRKKTLVDYGFRLPSALDNRPLRFDEFEDYMRNAVFVSATPGAYELEGSRQVVEQIIRPTGLVDPVVEVHPIDGQIEDVLFEIKKTIARGDRILITTLTKRLAEELTEYLAGKGVRTRYLHSDIKTIERTEIIRQLRLGRFDVLVGINLLREGLDIPEVGFIGILDADKEGFLRDARSLIQTIGRASRNAKAMVVLYADKMTDSIKKALSETERRRNLQIAYNRKHNIIPQTIKKPVREKEVDLTDTKHLPKSEIPNLIIELEAEMQAAADALDFERAIKLRDVVKGLRVQAAG
jgi:excinuclease ABC subunit B